MTKIIKNLIMALVIAVIAITCFTACDLIGDLIGIGGGSCNHDFIEIYRNADCMSGGEIVYECTKCGVIQGTTVSPSEHVTCTVEGYAADCYNDGLTDGIMCNYCGTWIQEQEVIPAAHTIEKIEAVEPSCTSSGCTEGEQCSVCGCILKESEYLPESHEFIYYDYKEATCIEAGYTQGEKCSKCGYVAWGLTPIDISGHTLTVTVHGYDPTCTEEGLTNELKCDVCGFTEGQKVIDAYGHASEIYLGYASTCYANGLSDGEYCFRCNLNLVPHVQLPLADHTLETIPGYAATCTSTGLTDGAKCTVCDTTITEQTEIPMTMHTAMAVNGFAATCTSSGMSDGSVCKDCGKVFVSQHTIYSTGHTYDSNGVCTGCSIQITAELTYEEYGISAFSLDDGTVAYIVTGVEDGYTGNKIVIPETYNGAPVVGIKEKAFENNEYIEYVVIPKSIASVGADAFNGCTSLTTVEYSDFEQINVDEWSNALGGNGNVVFKAISNQGKSPYDIYIEAMNSINHNFKNYTWSTTSNSYIGYDYAVLNEMPEYVGYLAMQIVTLQKQQGDNFYFSQTNTDYMSSGAPSETNSIYYVDGYLYQYAYSYWQRAYISNEGWYGAMMADISTVEITPESFKNVIFYKDTDGKMYLELAFDPVVFTQMIEDLGGMSMQGMQIADPVYTYVFDANGDLESYGYTSSLKILNPETMNSYLTMFDMEVISTIYNKGTTYISAPEYSYEVDLANYYCKDGHTPVEVSAVNATCYVEGHSAFSYCSKCYAAITEMTVTEPAHSYVNGWCTECGTVQSGASISTGLAYVLNEDQTGYIVVGIGDCTDTDVYIPTHIYSLPIVEVKADAFANSYIEKIIIGNSEYLVAEFTGWQAEK